MAEEAFWDQGTVAPLRMFAQSVDSGSNFGNKFSPFPAYSTMQVLLLNLVLVIAQPGTEFELDPAFRVEVTHMPSMNQMNHKRAHFSTP